MLPPSCPYFEVPVIPAVNATIENNFLLNNPLCSFHAINSLSSFPLLLRLQLRAACQITPFCKGKKRQGRAWTRQEENLHRSCSQWQQLTRHKNGHGERKQPAWHFHLPHPPCSFWNTLSWGRGQPYFQASCSVLLLQLPEFLSPVVICKIKQFTRISLSAPALEGHFTFTLCKPQVFSLKSYKNWIIKRALDKTF